MTSNQTFYTSCLPMKDISVACSKWNVARLQVFGSVLRPDFRGDSDVDFLVEFINNDAGPWMRNLSGLSEDLSKLIGRKADVVPKSGLKKVLQDRVLRSAKLIYEN